MRALVCRQFGPPSALAVEEVAAPHPAADEVRIRVRAAGVNFPDVLLVQGLYQVKPPLPFTPGIEVAGEIVEVGAGVSGRHPGQRVFAFINHGGMAEEVCVPAHMVLPLPDAMPYEQGAAFPIAYGTSHVALAHRGQLLAGERLLVLGAGGGVGLAAVAIGVRLGAEVIAAASSDDKLALAREYGAHHTINYTQTDLRDAMRALTQDKGADVIYDPVGGDLFDAAVRVIAWEGRYLVIGFASGRIPELPVNRVLLKNSALVGVYWGAYAQHNPAVLQGSFATLLEWYQAGQLRVHVSQTYTLDEAKDALIALMERQALGKLVIVP